MSKPFEIIKTNGNVRARRSLIPHDTSCMVQILMDGVWRDFRGLMPEGGAILMVNDAFNTYIAAETDHDFMHFVKHGPNWAANQEKWDKGEVSLEACYRKGGEHKVYGWANKGLPFPATKEQQAAYDAGYADETVPATEVKPCRTILER